jgi:hypothetical protein
MHLICACARPAIPRTLSALSYWPTGNGADAADADADARTEGCNGALCPEKLGPGGRKSPDHCARVKPAIATAHGTRLAICGPFTVGSLDEQYSAVVP